MTHEREQWKKAWDALAQYVEHEKECEVACIQGWSPKHGYSIHPYRGEAYTSKEKPACTCGLENVLRGQP